MKKYFFYVDFYNKLPIESYLFVYFYYTNKIYEKLLLVFNENDNNILKDLSKGDKIMKEYINDSRRASEQDEVIGMYDKELHDGHDEDIKKQPLNSYLFSITIS